MIASNYRKFPEAMALQLVLVFGRCTWHTARPTTRIGRAVRAQRARLVKQTPQVVRWVAKAVPSWWKEAKRAAKALAKQVKAAMLPLVWDLVETQGPTLSECAASVLAKARLMRPLDYKGRPVKPMTFTWLIQTNAKYASWEDVGHQDSHDMRKVFWQIEKRGSYRD